jgi:hypothetical protein
MIPTGFKGAAIPRTAAGIATAAKLVGCDPLGIQAIIDVETGGSGFLPDGRPRILFEGAHFSIVTKHFYDAGYPEISRDKPGGYVGGAGEYDRLAAAIKLDQMAALECTSWGLPQIMGSNFALAGFDGVTAMVETFCMSEDLQLGALASFIVRAGLAADLQHEDFADFARRYNGPNYAVNAYDKKLIADLARLRARAATGPIQASPERDLNRKVQLALNLKGFGPLDADGWIGAKTSAALRQFQAASGLPVTGLSDPATDRALLG